MQLVSKSMQHFLLELIIGLPILYSEERQSIIYYLNSVLKFSTNFKAYLKYALLSFL